ncbi:hypothetical protein [Microbacterium enclense]|uniref:hypothetical protein n=1 Tax=Microbacterium enclense TaxID=993073 RepID=UPI003F7DA464
MEVTLVPPLPLDLSEEVSRRVLFVDRAIADFTLQTSADGIESVRIDLSDGDPVMIAAKLRRVIDREVRPLTLPASQSVWESAAAPTFAPLDLDVLERVGAVRMLGAGRAALGGIALRLFLVVDEAIRRLAVETFGATEFRYPTVISTEAISLAGYLDSFPHHVMLATHIDPDADVYDRFRTRAKDQSLLEFASDTSLMLPPTLCYHTFDARRGATFDPETLVVETCRGKAFRYESGYASGLERLWDFTIREIVFIGTRERTARARDEFMWAVQDWLESLEVAAACTVASDPFFAGADPVAQVWAQRLMKLKYELRLPIAPDRTIAAASFNVHGDVFGNAFDLRFDGGASVSSACVGVGLERMTFALLSRFGLDPEQWPSSLGGQDGRTHHIGANPL